MNQRRHGLKVLGVSLIAALGLMAFGAAGAQASGEWRIGGKTMSELGLTEETVTGKAEAGVKEILLVKTLNIQKSCTGFDIQSVTISPSGKGKGAVRLLGCKVFADEAGEAELTACGVKSTGQEAGVIQTELIGGEIVLSGGVNYVLFKPASGTSFTTIELTGASCAPKGTYPITGTVVAELGAEAKELLLKPIKEFTGDGLKFGENKAFLIGSGLAELTGAKKGSAWTGF